MRLTTENKNDNHNNYNDSSLFEKYFDLPLARFGRNRQQMKTDIIENKEKYMIIIDIPGFDKKNIKVHVGDKYLTVYLNKKSAENTSEGSYIYRERFCGTASRSFYIGNIKESSINAKYENGTLILNLPKAEDEEEQSKWIDIN
jgi:HSP20 family molecular chaperone IbpA